MAIGDSTFCQIVGGELQGNAITGENPDAVPAELTREVGQNDTVLIELNAEQTTWKLLNDSPSYFNTIFLTHQPPWQDFSPTAGAKPGS